jgi:thiol-disulfide isomerase/thioredoxin
MGSGRGLNRPLAIFITVLSLLSINQFSYANEEIQPGDNQPLPDIRWQDEDGKTHHLKDTNGKPRLLHFWAAWCVPCRKELPEMLKWQEENKDILVLPLSLDQRIAQTKHFIKKNKIAMSPLLINKDDSEALSIPVVPYTVFVSADGLFAGHFYGIAPWENNDFANQVRQQFGL